MFVGKARSQPHCGSPRRCFTQVGSGLTCRDSTMVKPLPHLLKVKGLSPATAAGTGDKTMKNTALLYVLLLKLFSEFRYGSTVVN